MKFNVDPKIAATLIRGRIAMEQITQKELALKLSLNYDYLSMYLNGHVSLFPDQIETLCGELGIKERVIELSNRGEKNEGQQEKELENN